MNIMEFTKSKCKIPAFENSPAKKNLGALVSAKLHLDWKWVPAKIIMTSVCSHFHLINYRVE